MRHKHLHWMGSLINTRNVGNAKIKRKPGNLFLKINFCDGDSIDLVLEENGALKGNKIYLPVIEVRGKKSNTKYSYLDLNGFVFENLANEVESPLSSFLTSMSGQSELDRFGPSHSASIVVRNHKKILKTIYRSKMRKNWK